MLYIENGKLHKDDITPDYDIICDHKKEGAHNFYRMVRNKTNGKFHIIHITHEFFPDGEYSKTWHDIISEAKAAEGGDGTAECTGTIGAREDATLFELAIGYDEDYARYIFGMLVHWERYKGFDILDIFMKETGTVGCLPFNYADIEKEYFRSKQD